MFTTSRSVSVGGVAGGSDPRLAVRRGACGGSGGQKLTSVPRAEPGDQLWAAPLKLDTGCPVTGQGVSREYRLEKMWRGDYAGDECRADYVQRADEWRTYGDEQRMYRGQMQGEHQAMAVVESVLTDMTSMINAQDSEKMTVYI